LPGGVLRSRENTEPGKRFCADCGALLANRCPKCGSENPAGKGFCGDRGAALGSDSSVPIAEAVNLPGTHPGGERRHLTVLFATWSARPKSCRGSTLRSGEKLSPTIIVLQRTQSTATAGTSRSTSATGLLLSFGADPLRRGTVARYGAMRFPALSILHAGRPSMPSAPWLSFADS
jgi:hypothetical protein